MYTCGYMYIYINTCMRYTCFLMNAFKISDFNDI